MKLSLRDVYLENEKFTDAVLQKHLQEVLFLRFFVETRFARGDLEAMLIVATPIALDAYFAQEPKGDGCLAGKMLLVGHYGHRMILYRVREMVACCEAEDMSKALEKLRHHFQVADV